MTRATPKAMMQIPMSRPSIDDDDVAAVLEVLRSPSFSMGPKVREFERAIAAYAGTAATRKGLGKPLEGCRVRVLGVANNRDMDDRREIPSFEPMELLLDPGTEISVSDPHIPHLPAAVRGHTARLESYAPGPESLAVQACVLVAPNHASQDWPMIAGHPALIVETRGPHGASKIRAEDPSRDPHRNLPRPATARHTR